MDDQNREGLKQQLIKVIDVVDFMRKNGYPEWSGEEQQKLSCPMAATRHEDGDDSSPSLMMNPHTGAFNCYGCGFKGTSIVGFATDVIYQGKFNYALATLYGEYVRQLVPRGKVAEAHKYLTSRPSLMQKIAATRGWTEETIRKLRIGWSKEDKRSFIPIYNLEGLCVDYRLHDTLYRAPLVDGKRVPAKGDRNSRTGDWFPLLPNINPLLSQEIWLLEGEPDCILAMQDGLNCITVTGGAGAWKALDHERLRVFTGKDVIVCLDNDKAGQDAAQVLCERLTAVGIHSLKNLRLPQGKDFSDYLLKYGGSASALKQYAIGTEYLIKPTKRNAITVPLSETSRAEHIGKTVRSTVIISGKAQAPQAVPECLTLTCHTEDYCSACPCKHSGSDEYFVDAKQPEVLDWLYCRSFEAQVKKEKGLATKCPLKVEVKTWQNLEQVTLIPALSTSRQADEGAYSVRRGFYIGHGIEANEQYEIQATPTVHPKTKDSVLLVEKAEGSRDSITQFKLSQAEITELKVMFSDEPMQIIRDICKMFAANHTHIYGRWDVHAAVDLVFHSLRDFSFADTQLPKGSMELLLFGDTRCGKGQIGEGLTKFYDLGQVVSGENASFMGLCGGAQKAGDNFQLSWGAIPINNGRLVVIDEFSGLDKTVLGRLSRVRSEGIAEINKGGINTRTRANTRLIWIANPDKGREVASYANGVSAIMELIGTNEDVARFDLAVVVMKGEVDISVINAADHDQVRSKYTQEALRKVLLWVWSRRPEHVVFTRQATQYILAAANRLAQMYSATIPLIQGENARFKVAKLAAAIAARCFATEDGTFLRVTEKHAALAVKFLNHFYGKPSMGYHQFSAIELGSKTLVDSHLIDQFMDNWDIHKRTTLVDGLLSTDKFGVREIQDWLDVDANIAKKFCGLFVRCQATRQLFGGLYVKKAAFISYLKELKKKDK